jgi:hypothetical protein
MYWYLSAVVVVVEVEVCEVARDVVIDVVVDGI